MRNPLYLAQLKRDLERWIAEGLVDARHREAILANAGEIRLGASLSGIFFTLGAASLGVAALAFVAANWQGLGKLARLVVLFGAMWLAYGAAMHLTARGRTALGQAFVLLGVALFGANINLVAQTYHISAHAPDGFLLWAGGALLAAALVPSRAALAVGLLIAAYWTWMESLDFDVAIHWPYLAYLALATFLAHRLRWWAGLHLAMLSVLNWLLANTGGLADALGLEAADMIAFYVLAWLTVMALAQIAAARGYPFARALAHYAAFLLAVAVFCLQFAESPAGGRQAFVLNAGVAGAAIVALAFARLRQAIAPIELLGGLATAAVALAVPLLAGTEPGENLLFAWAAGALVIAFFVWIVAVGAGRDDRFLVNWGFVGLGAEALWLYTETFDTFLDSALFFFAGGVFLIALGYVLERARRHLLARKDPGGGRP
ncbi:MAG: DUF2157 domain-containing protein [Alphaproteobacteria bacterium]|nr:DUF2157 domain-containing protein [Alphaproteobacteria bacterium]